MNTSENRARSGRVRALAAVAGGAAVVALGVYGAADGQSVQTKAAGSHMNVGQTSTETTPPKAPIISMAVPTIKGPAPLPSEEKNAE
ncbi:hypothetical protein ACWDTP_14760 [Mycobacterium sp. NPDC003449]